MPESDGSLVERARRGDADAFERLVRRHLRTAYLTAVAAVAEPADAEDICQDAFLTALERLEDCRQPDRFLPWLLRIVRNRAHSFHRYRAVRRALPLDQVTTVADRSADPARDATRSELRQKLIAGLETLPPVQREVVLLHDLEGWRHREIAELLQIPEGTVRAHLSYARRALRNRLGCELWQESVNGLATD
ncbi:MAG TPA: RNA polymerase sigma factor [Longimicrobiales bacterium]